MKQETMKINELQTLALEVLKEEVKPAMGCTEPVAVALAAAKAAETYKAYFEVENLPLEHMTMSVKVNPNLFKNGLAVGIPNCPERGIHVAGALGITACHSDLGLNVFADMTKENVDKAITFAKAGKVELGILDTTDKVRVEIELHDETHRVFVVLSGKHDRFDFIEVDDACIWKNEEVVQSISIDKTAFFKLKVEEIVHLASTFSKEQLEFLQEGLDMNWKVAQAGIEKPLGMGVGYHTLEAVKEGILGDDIVNRALAYTAAASDARMSGLNLPVMSSNGSGNNGLTAILPLVAWFEKHPTSELEMLQAAALSHLLNCYIKDRIGRLSAMCSCSVSAATGSGAAIAWLMSKDIKVVERTITNMAGNLTGMICDGGKEGCALKLGTGAAAGIRSALLAKAGVVVPAGNGIIDESLEKTIENMGIISQQGMQITDETILNVMLDRVKMN